VIAAIGVAGLELDGLLAAQAESCLQAQTHVNMRISDAFQFFVTFLGFVLAGNVVTLGNPQLGVVRRQDTGLADFFGPPAQVRETILQRTGGQSFGLPALQQDFDVLAFEQAGAACRSGRPSPSPGWGF